MRASFKVIVTMGLLTFAAISLPAFGINIGGFAIGSGNSTLGDMIGFGRDAVKDVVSNVDKLIPSPESILIMPKNLLVGLPVEVVMSAVDKMCSLVISAGNSTQPFKQPKISEMSYMFHHGDEVISIPMTEASKLWHHPKFNPKKKVVIMVTGWTSDAKKENSAAEAMWKAYKSRDEYNFVLIDTTLYVDTLYAWSAFNTVDLGINLGKALAELSEIIAIEKIHLIGHSLGAHIVGSAGKQFQIETDKILPRITGLDPAKPCFKEGESLMGLGRGDADFVDVIHSDSGALGKAEAIGDADFFPNGIVSLMPGCLHIFCSHSRAWEYYAETVYKGNEHNFMAKKCGSLYSYDTSACITKEVPMGYACSNKTKGNFFLKTNSASPFGRAQQKRMMSVLNDLKGTKSDSAPEEPTCASEEC